MYDIELFQNIVSFSLSCITAANLYWYYYVDEACLSYSMPILLFHFSYDVFLTNKIDVKLHHIFCGSMIIATYLFNIESIYYNIPLLALYKTEICSFFYVTKLLKPLSVPLNIFDHMKDLFFQLNDILFFITFFKLRIYDYYNEVIINQEVYDTFNIYTNKNTIAYILLYGGMHGVFLLNSYWFALICKINLKKMIKYIPEITQMILCHRFVSYTLIVNVMIGYYLYSQTNTIANPDMTGLILLAGSSYIYHNKLDTILSKENIFDYISDDVVYLFVTDMGIIHVRSFLCLFTNYAYTNNDIILWYSFINHILCFSSTCCYIWIYKLNREHIFYDKSKKTEYFLKVINTMMILPTTFSILSIVYNTSDIITANNIFYTTYFCGLALIISPLYELSHGLFHIGLLVQTYYLVSSNIQNIL
jgi:hypothetical protein